jgi:adenylate kinase
MVAAPGAGKGTQAQRLAAHYGIAKLSSGDILRREVAAGSEVGRQVADYLRRGDLVPDELALELIAGPVVEAAANGGYVLDGFPRTLHQAKEAYRTALQVSGIELQAVIHLEVSRAELRRRMLARADTEGRSDDTDATIEHRLDVYDNQTQPLLSFYAERGLVIDVNGEQSPDDVFRDIVAAIDEREVRQAGL